MYSRCVSIVANSSSCYFKERNFREAKKLGNVRNKLSRMIPLEIFCENQLSQTILYDIFRDDKLSRVTKILIFFFFIIIISFDMIQFFLPKIGHKLLVTAGFLLCFHPTKTDFIK